MTQVSLGGTVAVRAEGAQLLNSSPTTCERRGPMAMKNERTGKEGLFPYASCQGKLVEQRGDAVGGLWWLLWWVSR